MQQLPKASTVPGQQLLALPLSPLLAPMQPQTPSFSAPEQQFVALP
jgi:hypothetical protein